MAALILDSGALIAADRNDRRFWSFLKSARERGIVAIVPAGALAQAWRGKKSARLAQLLSVCEVESLDEPAAKAAGELCGRPGTSDVIDASVVLSAAIRKADLLTGDPRDLRRLAQRFRAVRILDLAKV